MKKIVLAFMMIAIFFCGCKKENIIEGHKILYINFSDAKSGKSIDSIYCFIGQPLGVAYRIIKDTLSDENGNCKLETDYKASDHYYFAIRNDQSFNGNKVFTYRGNNINDKYRIKDIIPYINLGIQNEFNLNIKLILLVKINIIYEFGKTYYGSVNFEIFENNESIYSIYRGGYSTNSSWTVSNKESANCYLSSIGETKLVYSFISNEGKTIFSKYLIIDPNIIEDKTIHVKFD